MHRIGILKKSEYKEYPVKSAPSKNADRFFQRKVIDDTGTRYFINCLYYKPITIHTTGQSIKDTFCFQLQLNSDIVESAINIEILFWKDNVSLAIVEEFIDSVWQFLGSKYYERNDE